MVRNANQLGAFDIAPQVVRADDPRLYAIKLSVLASGAPVLAPGSSEAFLQHLHRGGTPTAYLYSDNQGNKVGYLALVDLTDSDEMEVRSIAVEPTCQRRGYGTAMMLYAQEIAKDEGKKRMTLVAHPENTPGLVFYKGLGYTVEKRLENYFGDGEPRCVLKKTLE